MQFVCVCVLQVWQVNVLQSLRLSLSIKARKKRNTCLGSVWGPQNFTCHTAYSHCLPLLPLFANTHNSHGAQQSLGSTLTASGRPCLALQCRVAVMAITITVSSASIAIAHSACCVLPLLLLADGVSC